MLYSIIRFLLAFYIRCFFKVDVVGGNRIPSSGPVILAANHVSNNDPILIGCSIKRPVQFLAKQELFKFRLSYWLFKHILLAIPVDRDLHQQVRCVRQSLAVLENGKVYGIFPEGTRCRNGERVKPKHGVSFISYHSRAPIYPVALVRCGGGWRKRIKLVVGEAIYAPEKPYRFVTDKVMKEVYRLRDEWEETSRNVNPGMV